MHESTHCCLAMALQMLTTCERLEGRQATECTHDAINLQTFVEPCLQKLPTSTHHASSANIGTAYC